MAAGIDRPLRAALLASPRRRRVDRLLVRILPITAAAAGLAVAGIVGFVLLESLPALRAVGLWAPLTDARWQPLSGRYGMASMLAATLTVAALAALIAAPLGIGTAIFARCWAPPWLGRLLRAVQIILAGTPSVVFGVWGLTVVVPWIAAWQPPGASVLAAAIVLAMMIVPTVALTTDAAIAGVPTNVTCGAAALGMRKGAVCIRVTLPAARRGVLAGLVLAFGRAIGETMAVLMVAGNVVQWPHSLFTPVRTLTANIALEAGYASDAHRSVLFVGGLLLLGVVVLLSACSGWLSGTRPPHERGSPHA